MLKYKITQAVRALHIAALVFFIAATASAHIPSVLHFPSNSPLADRLREHVKYLASEELEGRAPGGNGIEKAAAYIAATFKKYGLAPKGTDGYFQSFQVAIGSRDVSKPLATVRTKRANSNPGPEIELHHGDDYVPMQFSDNGTLTGQIVFAGFGIIAPDQNYDDYFGLDVKGKVVVVFRGSPDGDNLHGDFGQYAALRSKALAAREKGAAGIIFINNRFDSVDVLMSLEGDPGRNSGIKALHLKREASKHLPWPAGTDLTKLEQSISEKKTPNSFEFMPCSFETTITLETVTTTTKNVIAFVPGTDPNLANEVIVVGAHYDHLGYGEHGSLYAGKEKQIHYGADDNASGTAGMMEIAKEIASKPLKRPVAFMAFSGEERGLLGSAHYVKDPVISLEHTAAMVNLDMIGRLNGRKLNVQGTGTSAAWDGVLEQANKGYAFELSKAADGFGPSDHSSFYGKKIPVLFFFTGLHTDYHRPTDTWEKVNYTGEDSVVTFVHTVVTSIANLPKKPEYVHVQAPASSRTGTTGFKVTVGIIPDYSDHPKGMKITGVRDGSPGQKAGMQADDVIIQFGSVTVKNVYDYTDALSKYKVGDEAKIMLLRGVAEEKIEVTVKFEARK